MQTKPANAIIHALTVINIKLAEIDLPHLIAIALLLQSQTGIKAEAVVVGFADLHADGSLPSTRLFPIRGRQPLLCAFELEGMDGRSTSNREEANS